MALAIVGEVGEGADGWSAEKVFSGSSGRGFSFDDFVFLPAMNATASVEKVSTRFTRNIMLNVPIVGAPGPSVTEDRMAIAMANAGGIGIIHKNQSISEQAAMIRKVKQEYTAFIITPTVLGPRHTIADFHRLTKQFGCSSIPITDNGKVGGKLVGLVTIRDVDAVEPNLDGTIPITMKLQAIMVTDVTTATEPITFREAKKVMQEKRVAKLPIVNKEKDLVALICRGDMKKVNKHPGANRDPNVQLLVAAALSVDEEEVGDGLGWDRAEELVNAGADALLLETDDGVTEATTHFLKRLKGTYTTTEIICGRVSSVHLAEELCKAGADALLVGSPIEPLYSSPSFATTCGVAEASVLYQIARLARLSYSCPVIAEGGVHTVADVVKAFALGASSVAPRDLLSRTVDSPGDTVYRNGVRVKLRRRSAGEGVRRPVENTIEGAVVDGGSVEALLPHLVDSVKAGLQELGLRGFADVSSALATGALRLEVVAPLNGNSKQVPPNLQSQRITSSPLFDRW